MAVLRSDKSANAFILAQILITGFGFGAS